MSPDPGFAEASPFDGNDMSMHVPYQQCTTMVAQVLEGLSKQRLVLYRAAPGASWAVRAFRLIVHCGA